MIKGIEPRLSEGGKIKIGRKGEWITSRKGTEFQPPQKLDHFLVTRTVRDQDGNFAIDNTLMQALKSDPDGKTREIPIVLHSDEIDEVFPTAYARYAGRTCACRGDGEQATQWEIVDGLRTGRNKVRECPCEQLEAKRCKPTGVLHCSIAVEGLAVAGSVYKWRTTSIISIQEMVGSLLHIKQTCGVFRGLPLTLIVKPVQVRPQGKASTVYTCYVELRAKDLAEVQRQALQMAQMRQALSCDNNLSRRAYLALLEDPGEDRETEEEQAAVADEFYPEQQAAQVTATDALADKLQAGSRTPTEEIAALARENRELQDGWARERGELKEAARIARQKTEPENKEEQQETRQKQSEELKQESGYRAAIAMMREAETVEAVHGMLRGEKRKRVIAAGHARIREINASLTPDIQEPEKAAQNQSSGEFDFGPPPMGDDEVEAAIAAAREAAE